MQVPASGGDLYTQINVAVAKKAMDHMRQQGAAAIELMQAAGDVQKAALGSASRRPSGGYGGVGGRLDTYA